MGTLGHFSMGSHTSSRLCRSRHPPLSWVRPLDTSTGRHHSFNWGDRGSPACPSAFIPPQPHVPQIGPGPLCNPVAVLHQDESDSPPQNCCWLSRLPGDSGHWETSCPLRGLLRHAERPEESVCTRERCCKLGEAGSRAHTQVCDLHIINFNIRLNWLSAIIPLLFLPQSY